MNVILLSSCNMSQPTAGMCMFRHLGMSCCPTCEINCHWFTTEGAYALKDGKTYVNNSRNGRISVESEISGLKPVDVHRVQSYLAMSRDVSSSVDHS